MADSDNLDKMLKAAKSRKMNFVFVCKGSDGKLLVSKGKIAGKQIAEAKQEVGGGTIYKGKCSGPINDMVFEVAKDVPGTLKGALKRAVKNDCGLTVIADFKVAADAEVEEEEEGGGAAPAEAAAPEPAVAAAAPPAAREEAAPSAEEEPELDLSVWQAARGKAISGMKSLAAKVASTKHETAAGVLKEIQSIIARLPANPKLEEIDKLEAFISTEDAITAVDEVPDEYHDQNLREELLGALESLKQSR